jgi:hypothetical protein
MDDAQAASDHEVRNSLIVLARGWRALALQIDETLAARQ